jgi:hypothetical protein
VKQDEIERLRAALSASQAEVVRQRASIRSQVRHTTFISHKVFKVIL